MWCVKCGWFSRVYALVLFLLFILPLALGGGERRDGESREGLRWGYVSFLEGQASHEHPGLPAQRATIRQPVISGDKIATLSGGRCEITFQNGSLLRLNENSQLEVRLTGVRGKDWWGSDMLVKIPRGEVYLMVRLDPGDTLMLETDNARVTPTDDSIGWLNADFPGETQLFVIFGKMTIRVLGLKGEGEPSAVHGDSGRRIDKSGRISMDYGRNREFLWWNESLNKDAEKPHHGLQVLPEYEKRRPGGVREFIRSHSTVYGQWLKHEWFGYIWRPDDPAFHDMDSPFGAGERQELSGRVFLVPMEAWGWTPAHAGIWVRLQKTGWHWIPGEHISVVPAMLDDFMIEVYETWSLYLQRRANDIKAGAAPRQVRDIIRRLNAAPPAAIEKEVRFSAAFLKK